MNDRDGRTLHFIALCVISIVNNVKVFLFVVGGIMAPKDVHSPVLRPVHGLRVFADVVKAMALRWRRSLNYPGGPVKT